MFRLYKYLSKKHRWISAGSFLLTCIQVVSFLLISLFVGQIVGLISQSAFPDDKNVSIDILRITFTYASRKEAIKYLSIFFTIFLIIGTIGSLLAAILASYVSIAGAREIRNYLWNHLSKLSQKDLEVFTHAKIITRFTIDITRIQNGLISFLRSMVIGPFYLIFGLVFALLTNLNLSIIFAVLIPLLSITMIIAGAIIGPLFKKEQKMYDKINTESQENILGAKVIKSYNLEKIQLEKFEQANKNWGKISLKAWFSYNTTFNFISLFTNLATVFVVYISGINAKSITDELLFRQTIANVTTFTNYVMFITIGVLMVSFTIFTLARSKVSIKRVFEIIDKKPNIPFIQSDKKVTNGEIVFDHVSFRYFESSDKNVLDDISFSVKPGEILGIIGPTGSGKSTIARLINHDFKSISGNITIDNNKIEEIDSVSLHKNISLIYQNPTLLSGTIKSNLLLANPEASDEDILKASHNACAYSFISKFKNQFEHEVEQKGVNLSGGQKQRISIAQGIIRDPKILVLDDSTSALDYKTEAAVLENIKNEFAEKKISLVIITQKISSIAHADNILVLEHGKIIGSGKHDELINSNKLYREIAISQMGENHA
ncbi:ABC transporter ATP-binding protein [[Mycoplasma] phocae]|uniref:ABC transporter ATP-binding protein n=1 Tax=[Mycoplasma] phocae TaxID=142651 RepID=A0A2Z5ISU4_9BACT|nr:ABC transporter ATP-binding protein [[Mycoplasma] phocae]AXE60938.1 ABC transporter ATP-binding protein [[Mycoplasma] phocae]